MIDPLPNLVVACTYAEVELVACTPESYWSISGAGVPCASRPMLHQLPNIGNIL